MPASWQHIRPSWIAFGWFIAAALTALMLLALVSIGVLEGGPWEDETWVAVAFALGFIGGGYLVGWRVGTAPTLHGVGIGLFSLVVWFLANLLAGEPTGQTAWQALPVGTTAALLLLQTAAAVVGARIGARTSRVG